MGDDGAVNWRIQYTASFPIELVRERGFFPRIQWMDVWHWARECYKIA